MEATYVWRSEVEKTQLHGKVLEANEGNTGVDTGEDQRRQIEARMNMTVPPH